MNVKQGQKNMANNAHEHDLFYDLERPTIANAKSALTWAKNRSIKTFIDYLDCSKSTARQPSDMNFGEVLNLVNKTATQYFRIIFRKNYNWFGILSTDAHVEDVIEIGIRGIMVGKQELFIFSYLKKELFDELNQEFSLLQIT